MIIKGGSRAAPGQLAYHLQRVDTNERVRILELDSPASNLKEAFRDWQTLSEGTRGEKGLYHANIDPHAKYDMTPAQWKRAADVLEKELGFEGQPRAVVMHEKEGRQHIHVVWARTDIDTMTLRSDSQNYQAHERASAALEREFGHEHVPGKHAKRDREKQPEFPRAEANHAEWQQGERTGLRAGERKEQVTALRAMSDSAAAFKAALEAAGYVLAKGDRRGLVIVDGGGEVFSLNRHVTDMKAKDLAAFMEPLSAAKLPTVEEAKLLQQQAREQGTAEIPTPAPEAERKGVEASKFVKAPATPEAAQTAPAPQDAKLAATLKALEERQQEEAAERRDQHAQALRQKGRELDRELKDKLAGFDAIQAEQREALNERHAEKREGFGGVLDAAKRRLNPKEAARQEQDKQRESQKLERRLEQERKDYLALLEKTRQLEIENLAERHAQEMGDMETRNNEERDRYIREHQEAQRILADLQEQQRREELERGGPEPPKRTK